MSPISYVLAVDGGGTKTAAALLSMAGQELATARSGPANVYRDPAAGLAEITTRMAAALCDGGPAGRGDGGADRDQRRPRRCQRRGRSGRPSPGGVPGVRRAAPVAATATPRFSACSAPAPGAHALDRHRRRGLSARAGRRPAHLAAAGAFRWPIAAAAPGSVFGSPASISIGSTAAPSSPTASFGMSPPTTSGDQREAILTWLANARAAEFAPWRPPWSRPPAAGDALAEALLDEGRRISCAWPRHSSRARKRHSAWAVASARSTGPGSRRRSAMAPCCRPSRRPDPIRGAWLVATGQAPAEFPDVD